MKKIAMVICAVFAVALMGCEDTEDANAKINQCLEDTYGADAAEEMLPDWELTCDEADDACKDCIDCVLAVECNDLLDGECEDSCVIEE